MEDLINIRTKLSSAQRGTLAVIWRHYVNEGRWMPVRQLHKDGGGRQAIRPLLEGMGGSAVLESERNGILYYELTFLGVLLSSDGEMIEELLCHYLRVARSLALGEPTRTHVSSEEVGRLLNLSPHDVRTLGRAVFMSPLLQRGGHTGTDQWNAELPRDIEDLPDGATSLLRLIREIAAVDYDPLVPVPSFDRANYYLAARERSHQGAVEPEHAADLHAGPVIERRGDEVRAVIEDEVVLEKEQEEFLDVVVRASRAVPRESRTKFIYIAAGGGNTWIQHPGLPGESVPAYRGDIEALESEGLLLVTLGRTGTLSFDVSPRGFRHYERLKMSQGEPATRVESETHRYLESAIFQRDAREAFQRWSQAERLLWGSDSVDELTAIGHLSREALQVFASAMVTRFHSEDADPNEAHTVARLRSVVAAARTTMPTGVACLLDALVDYWGAVSDLAQRQEHGAAKEGEQLVWEDARRLVFQTANLLFEFHSVLCR